MKKSLLLLFAALLPLVASAEKVEIDGIWYNLVPKAKQAEVTFKGDSYDSYNDEYSGSITIPATVTQNGVAYSVTSIGSSAFFGCSSLTAITISEGVTSIEDYALCGCSSLTTITIPESVTSIGDYAFSGCTSLASITIPEGVTSIGCGAFEACISFTCLTIPESVTSIGERTFCGCSNLTTITIPGSVTSIGGSTFSDCRSLTTITLSAGVTSIGEFAFSSCSSLTTFTIPESVTNIEQSAFRDCSSIESITIPEGVKSIRHNTFEGCSSLATIIIPESVGFIEDNAFYGCSSLTTITIPEGVATIDSHVFYGCSRLTTIVLSKSVYRIGAEAFANCLELLDVYCHAESVPWTEADANVFNGSYPEYATLHVPACALADYQTTAPWSSFKEIVPLEDVTLEKCATPTISYVNGEVVFACDTEGATIKSEVKENATGKFEDMRISLIPTYTITAYATKAQYEKSDEASLTICWIACNEDNKEDNGILTIPSTPVLISARDGVLTLSGLAEGTEVTLYTTDGAMVAQQQSSAGEAKFTVDTNQVYLVHIGDKVVKIGM